MLYKLNKNSLAQNTQMYRKMKMITVSKEGEGVAISKMCNFECPLYIVLLTEIFFCFHWNLEIDVHTIYLVC